MDHQPVRNDRHTLQLGPLWILSTLTGSSSNFTPLDRQAFADCLLEVILRTPPEARAVLESVAAAGEELFWDFELDDRSVVTGLWDVTAVLRGLEPELAADLKLAFLRVGVAIAKARGPYGKVVTAASEQQLQLLAELLELRPRPSEAA